MKTKISFKFRISTLSIPVRSHNCNDLQKDKIIKWLFSPNNTYNLISFSPMIAVRCISVINSINDYIVIILLFFFCTEKQKNSHSACSWPKVATSCLHLENAIKWIYVKTISIWFFKQASVLAIKTKLLFWFPPQWLRSPACVPAFPGSLGFRLHQLLWSGF